MFFRTVQFDVSQQAKLKMQPKQISIAFLPFNKCCKRGQLHCRKWKIFVKLNSIAERLSAMPINLPVCIYVISWLVRAR